MLEGRTSKLAVTAALVGFIVAASVAFEYGRPPAPTPSIPAPAAQAATIDRLDADLDRCNRLGPNDPPDQGCVAAWAEARRQFFGDKPQTGGRS